MGRSRQGRLFIVVSLYDWALHFLNDLNAFMGVGVITNDITQANEPGAALFLCVQENGLSRLEIGVKVAENRKTHDGVFGHVKKLKRYNVKTGARFNNSTI